MKTYLFLISLLLLAGCSLLNETKQPQIIKIISSGIVSFDDNASYNLSDTMVSYLPRTNGSVNPNVTQENINETICLSGWTATIRPNSAYTNRIKKEQIEEYGYADKNMSHYAEDHIIPLCTGGNPTDKNNLFPQKNTGEWNSKIKDKLEVKLQHMVCAGEIQLTEAQNCIGTNWILCYQKYYDNSISSESEEEP